MNVAQLVVSLTSDTASFSSGMRRAGAETATFEAAVKRAQRQGLDPMIARMGTAAQGAQAWDAGMRTMAGSTGTFAGSAAKAAVSANTFRSALTPLVASLVGIPGPLGNVASLLGSFAVGAGPIVAAVAGIGAVAAAWLHFTKAAREAGQAAQQAGERWSKSKERDELKEQEAALESLIATRQRYIDQLQSGRKLMVDARSGIARFAPLSEQDKAALRRQIEEAVTGDKGIADRSQRIAELKWIISPSAATIASAQATGRQLAQAVDEAATRWWEDDRAWMEGMGGGMVPTIPDDSIAPIHRGGRDRFGPNQGGESPYAEFTRKQQEAAAASQQFVDDEALRTQQWQDAWASAAQASAGEFMAFIDKVIDGSVKAQDILKLLLNVLLRVILSSIGGGGGGGGALLSSGGGALGLRASDARAGDTYHTTNVYQIQALDAKSVADLLMGQRHTIALATGRAMSESRSLSRMNRGW